MVRLPNPASEARITLAELLQDGNMTCGFCGLCAKPLKVFDGEVRTVELAYRMHGTGTEKYPSYKLCVAICARCEEQNLYVQRFYYSRVGDGDTESETEWGRRVHPIGRAPKAFPNTPEPHVKSYRGACGTINVSPEASACMSRRCLQGILSDQGYTQWHLAKQIDALLASKTLPTSLHKSVDAIRAIGPH
jgi:hypothetical protein